MELTVDRQTDGRLTAASRKSVELALQQFLPKRFGPRRQVICAISARGVLVRTLRLPVSAQQHLSQMVALQIERDFPLPPSELAWGFRLAGETGSADATTTDEHRVLVAAVRGSTIQEYAELFRDCGLVPRFTSGAVNLLSLVQGGTLADAVLDIGRRQSELLIREEGSVESLRILPFGGENLTEAIAQAMDLGDKEAERLKIAWNDGQLTDARQIEAIENAVQGAVRTLSVLVAKSWSGQRLNLAGKTALSTRVRLWLGEGLGPSTICEILEQPEGTGSSAVIRALEIETAAGRREPPLVMRVEKNGLAAPTHRSGQLKWAGVALGLLLVSVSFRYAEVVLRHSDLERRLEDLKTQHIDGPETNQELAFLKHLAEEQPPYLAVLDTLAAAAPQGAKFETVTMNRRGEVSFKATMRGSDQTINLRSELIASGFFTTVVVEEQAPSPQDRNSLSVRITARCKPVAEIRALMNDSTATANGHNRAALPTTNLRI